jgi:hypothetical protein
VVRGMLAQGLHLLQPLTAGPEFVTIPVLRHTNAWCPLTRRLT